MTYYTRSILVAAPRMSLSYKEKLELTIFGYVRLNYKDGIPDDITRICLHYYGKIEIIWDVFCTEIANCVTEDGLQVAVENRSPYSSFTSSTGWNKGIHSFTLEQLDSSEYQFAPGVISSEEISNIGSGDEHYFLVTENQNAVGYALDSSSFYKLQNGVEDYLFESNAHDIGCGDKVTVLVDCDEWKLVFYINDVICNKPIDIVKDKTYHPVFSVWEGRTVTLQLIETTIDIQNYKKDIKEED